MPLTLPKLDDRSYQEILRETIARIPAHTPEWTNHNDSDPGVTLLQLFAFMTENLLYRSNLIPDRNRRKFLQLLDVPMRPASAARGVVTVVNQRGPLETVTLPGGLPVQAVSHTNGRMWLSACKSLEKIARLGEDAGRVFLLENLNTAVDHPGTPFARADDTLALIEAVGSPHLKMNLDLYHAQIGEGNLIELIQRAGSAIGEIQVADVPGRKEPGTGEIHYPAIARALHAMGYTGVVGLEGWASGDSESALERFRQAFTL